MVNGITAWLFVAGRHNDLNIRSAFVHMAADAGVSLGVLLAGMAIYFTGRLWIDPAVSLGVVAVIAVGTWGLLRDTMSLALDAVPRGINPDEVERYLAELPGVRSVHHLHLWPMRTTETALTAHLVKPDAELDDGLLCEIDRELHDSFGIGHATIQFERNASRCNETQSPSPGQPTAP